MALSFGPTSVLLDVLVVREYLVDFLSARIYV